MRLLLDTHAWLWLQTTPERLAAALSAVEDPANELLLSAASAWEIAIKWKLGKLPLPEPPVTYLPDRMTSSGVRALAISHAHAVAVSALPPHHADPFDRLLIVQATAEQATLVTADRALEPYDVDVLWTV